jgi:hypothetical protein
MMKICTFVRSRTAPTTLRIRTLQPYSCSRSRLILLYSFVQLAYCSLARRIHTLFLSAGEWFFEFFFWTMNYSSLIVLPSYRLDKKFEVGPLDIIRDHIRTVKSRSTIQTQDITYSAKNVTPCFRNTLLHASASRRKAHARNVSERLPNGTLSEHPSPSPQHPRR